MWLVDALAALPTPVFELLAAGSIALVFWGLFVLAIPKPVDPFCRGDVYDGTYDDHDDEAA